MRTEKNIRAEARRLLEKDAAEHRRRREAEQAGILAAYPELGDLQRQIREVFLRALKSPLPQNIEQSGIESLELQQKLREAVSALGCEPNIFEEIPLCKTCRDTGNLPSEYGGGLCECLKERIKSLRTAALSSLLDLRGQTFETFNAELFSDAFDSGRNGSPRQHIDICRDICYDFCRRFGNKSKNLFFSGPPGTGKTFLSACVAGELVKKGISVVYDTAVRQLNSLEAVQFGRGGEEAAVAAERLRECDLLIIDDLGAEFTTTFAAAALLDLINTRLIQSRKTLISSNLTRAGVRERYSPALASRLEGEFEWLEFFGEDLRGKR